MPRPGPRALLTALPATKARGPVRVLAVLRGWLVTWRSRRQLSRLPPELLRDVGLTERNVHEETQRPFWDCPDYWNRR